MPKLSRSELANLAIGLPIVTSIIGLLVGVGVGFGVGWAVKPKTVAPTDEQVARLQLDAFSADQIEFKCGQIRGEELKTANERISALERERDEYEQKVLALEAKLDTRRTKASSLAADTEGKRPAGITQQRATELEAEIYDLQRQLNGARDQLASVTRQLFQAEEEKRQLTEALVATSTRLRETETQLAVQVGKTEEAKEDAMSQKWWRFLADSQLEICEKGNRKKMGRCREEVQSYLKTTQIRNKFVHCVRSEQATPAVAYLDAEDTMPRFAQFMDQENKVVRDWYVQLCDPTLPEATGFAPGSDVGFGVGTTTSSLTERSALDVDLDQLEDLDD
ncbi:MAG: hypothetical protein H6737_20350 [Alphaproteobacteria bacterium]|nr:hypothetical protein [Alphaproteobacteria bacterium]